MDGDWEQVLGRLIGAEDKRPFGDAELASGRMLQRTSFASQEAATNLLTKALRALDADQPEQARSYVDRAVHMPFDRHEEVEPVAMAVHMMLFNDVTDAAEGSGEAESAWLEAALGALSKADEPGRSALRDVLATIDQDYRLPKRESASLRAATAEILAQPELRDLRVAPQEMSDHVMSVLTVCRDYRARLSSR